jgi:membrane-bound serine protease (ClpP class)
MRRAAPLTLLVAALLASFARPATASPETSGDVVIVKVDGSIDRTLSSYLRDQLSRAEDEGAVVVIQLDSAGTLDQDAVALAQRIHDATVPVIVWAGPTPAKAQGAGLLFMYAASLGGVAPGAGVGPLDPLDLTRPDEDVASAEDLARGWAEDFGKPTPIAFPEEPVPAAAALEGNIAQVAAVSVTDLLAEIDGMTVTTADGEVTLRTKIARSESERPVTVRFTDLGPVDRVLHAAASPTWIFVLLVLGFAGLAFEITQPGFGFAGFSGIALLGLGIYGLTVVPFSWLGLVLLVGGIGLMAGDVRLRKLGPLTGFGLLAFLLGSILLFGSVAPAIRVSPWLIGALTVASLLYYGFALTVALQSRERITSTQRGLVGLVGEARGTLDPEGPVFVKGTLWRGRSLGDEIPQGTRVRVRGLDGLVLRVEPEPETPLEPSSELSAEPGPEA